MYHQIQEIDLQQGGEECMDGRVYVYNYQESIITPSFSRISSHAASTVTLSSLLRGKDL